MSAIGSSPTKWISFSWTTVTGYLSADSDLFLDIVNVRLRVDMQSSEIYTYIAIVGEGEKCIIRHSPAGKQPGETICRGCDQ